MMAGPKKHNSSESTPSGNTWGVWILLVAVAVALAVAAWVFLSKQESSHPQPILPASTAEESGPSEDLGREVRSLVGRGRTSRAVTLLKDHLSAFPGDLDAWVLLGEILVKTDQSPRAEEIADRFLARHPDNAKLLWLKGMARGARGQADAQIWLAKAVESPDAPARILSSYGQVLLGAGQKKQAAQWLERAYQQGVRDVRTLCVLGRLNLEARQFAAARSYLEEAVETDPDSFEAHLLLIEALRALGDQASRRGILRRAAKLAPSDRQRAGLLLTLAGLEELEERYEEAAETYKQAARWEPARGNALYQAAWNHYQDRSYRKAEAALNGAQQILGATEHVQQLRARIESARQGHRTSGGRSGWFQNAPSLPWTKESEADGQESQDQEQPEEPMTPQEIPPLPGH
jgi:Tfp pilus assembly protein PilF